MRSTLPIDFPSLLPRRVLRVADALHDWRYVDGMLDAMSGQAATFDRASEGTAIDASGRVRKCARKMHRIEMLDLDNDGIRETAGLLLEGARDQRLDNPHAPATQTKSLPAGTYTCWLDGTGSVTLSGGTSGTVTAGSPVTFTLGSTQSVTFTVAGGPTRFQCENSRAPTSFMYAASRAADILTYPHLALPQACTIYTRIVDRGVRAGVGDNLGVYNYGSAASSNMALALFGSTNGFTFRHVGGTTQSAEVATSATYNLVVEFRAVVLANGSIKLGVSISYGAESIQTNGNANALGAAYSAATLHMGLWSTNKNGNFVLLEHRHLPGEVSLAACRSMYP